MVTEDYNMQGSAPSPGRVNFVIEGAHVFVLPSTTLSGTFPTMKSSSEGPSLRVELNEGFVGAEAEAVETVANERTAILEVR